MEDGSNHEFTVYNPKTRVFEVKNQAETIPVVHELERKASEIYSSYFGSNWRTELDRTLFINVRSATSEDRQRVSGNAGWVATEAEVITATNRIVGNRITLFNPRGASDFPLRTEIGEALWNMLENSAVTKSVPTNKRGVASGFQSLISDSVTPEAVADFSGEILDKWSQAYTQKPSRYAGMNPNSTREYGNIPEWKSEGFADAIAVEVRRRSGQPVNPHEQQIWDSLNHYSQEIAKVCTDTFLPPIQST